MGNNLFVELLQLSLDTRGELSRVPSELEWQFLLEESERQAVAGIMMAGLERLPKNQRPPQAILLQWIGVCQQIEVQNTLTTKTCQQLCKQLDSDGFELSQNPRQLDYMQALRTTHLQHACQLS